MVHRVCYTLLLKTSENYNYEKRGERRKKERKRPQRHIDAPIIIPQVPSEKSWWDKSNDTKRIYQRWLEWTTLPVQKQVRNCQLWLVGSITN
jgi:hypothetical protein